MISIIFWIDIGFLIQGLPACLFKGPTEGISAQLGSEKDYARCEGGEGGEIIDLNGLSTSLKRSESGIKQKPSSNPIPHPRISKCGVSEVCGLYKSFNAEKKQPEGVFFLGLILTS